jgi:hypothetical protein
LCHNQDRMASPDTRPARRSYRGRSAREARIVLLVPPFSGNGRAGSLWPPARTPHWRS